MAAAAMLVTQLMAAAGQRYPTRERGGANDKERAGRDGRAGGFAATTQLSA